MFWQSTKMEGQSVNRYQSPTPRKTPADIYIRPRYATVEPRDISRQLETA